MKIIYCGYDFFSACLQSLLESRHEILQVFSFPCTAPLDSNTYIQTLCNDYQLPYTQQRISKSSILDLKKNGADTLITAGYPYKIPELDDIGIRGINVHPMLLPNGKGVWPLPWVILNSLEQAGVSIHKLTPQWDSGEILLQTAFDLSQRDNLETVTARSQLAAKQLVATCFQDFDRYWDTATPQQGNGSYWGYPSQQDRSINWQSGIETIDRTCRAFGKVGCFARFDNQLWLVTDLNVWPDPHHYPAGQVIHKTNTEMIVAASDGLCSMRYFHAAPAIIL